MFRTFFRRSARIQRIASLSLAAAFVFAVVQGAAAETGMLHLRCTNAASGTSWAVVIDLDRRQVDALPATITDKWISWPDPKQGMFDFERATGRLQFRNASSTGGYILSYTCRRE